MKTYAAFLPLFLMLGLVPAHAAPAKEEVPPSAIGLVDMFDQSCIAYAGREKQMRVWADANLQVANQKQAPIFLGELGGKVWLKRDPAGNYALIDFDYGLCTIKAERAPVNDVIAYFEKTAAPKLKLAMTSTGDDANGVFVGIPGRVRTFALPIDGVQYNVIISGMQDGTPPLQSQITLILSGENDDDLQQ